MVTIYHPKHGTALWSDDYFEFEQFEVLGWTKEPATKEEEKPEVKEEEVVEEAKVEAPAAPAKKSKKVKAEVKE